MKKSAATQKVSSKLSFITKATLLLVLTIGLIAPSTVNAQEETKPTPKNRTLSNGFSIKIEYGIPSSKFGTYYEVDDEMKYGISYGLQMGNQWYFSPSKNFGIGLNVNWFDISFAGKSYEDGTRASIDASLLEIGPILTYAQNSQMAIDLYYNLRPTAIINFIDVEITEYNPWSGDWEKYSYNDTWQGAGITHAIGGGFRWRALSVGMEYVFGNVNDTDDLLSSDEYYKMYANCFRFLIGAKF